MKKVNLKAWSTPSKAFTEEERLKYIIEVKKSIILKAFESFRKNKGASLFDIYEFSRSTVHKYEHIQKYAQELKQLKTTKN